MEPKMGKDKIEVQGSIYANGGSTISNSRNFHGNSLNTIKTKYTFLGFFLGILSSIIAN
jgi:hypothetical protein